MTEVLAIVDEEDNVIGEKPRSEVEKDNLLYREANIIVTNEEGEILTHQRSKDKFLYPGTWDVKFGGCVQAGETYEETAQRELEEEAGIRNAKLDFLFFIKIRSDIHRSNKKVFSCIHDGPFILQESEVLQGKFMGREEIVRRENEFSPTAKAVYNKYKEHQHG